MIGIFKMRASAILYLASCLSLVGARQISLAAPPEEEDLRDRILSTLQVPIDDGEDPIIGLRILCGKSPQARTNVCRILMSLLKEGLTIDFKDPRMTRSTRDGDDVPERTAMVIRVLGMLQCEEAVPLLMNAAEKRNAHRYRERVIPAIIRIADTNMLVLARQVCMDVTTFTSSDRFNMYDEMIKLHLIPETNAQKKEEIIRFLMEVELIEVSQPNIGRIDPVICEHNVQWKGSFEREEVLSEHKGFETWLDDIKKIPADQRTHVAVRRLQVKEGPRAYHPNDRNAPKEPPSQSLPVATNAPPTL